MRHVPNLKAERYRVEHPYGPASGNNGALIVKGPNGNLAVIVSDGMGWEHASVSRPDRCPTWEEMMSVKELFWREDEWVIQYHPSRELNVNVHPFCLHLWNPIGVEFSKPPKECV